MQIKEFNIPVPWGHVAVKTWGNENDPHILCFHGILDNAGSFNRLIPLLDSHYYYICVDLPGHGRSSHFPENLPLYNIDNIIVYMLVAKYFKKEKYLIIGHSYGGQLAFFFAQVYPELVEKLIMLDTIMMFPLPAKSFKSYIREVYESYLVMDAKLKKNKQPEYTYEEALDRLQYKRSYGEVTKEAAEALLERSIKKLDNGKYVFTFDQRLKNFTLPLNDIRYKLETLKFNPVSCPILMVLARDSAIQQVILKKVLAALKKSKTIKIVLVNGDHDVHNTNPERVAPHIRAFLQFKMNKL
ncbi:serine hydrolase-like protein [Aethina tumida]|uniref:serine hydrolase-like protein n=1 Tax=Aethina tumida TaxID=116153 RepID=UPI002148054F|nr:serine hydrolase-like protein [Aethina tumida]